jgi:eukaryotic-like serine/threonine-protein kinase
MAGSAARETAVPHFVGRYEVLVPIASGGMATVYLARSRGAGGFEREVALKLTHAHLRESPDFQTLLIEEAKLASAIHHHNIVSVLDVGDDPLGLFLVMDYVEGDTLSGLMRRARAAGEEMPRPLAMRALLDSFAGLHAAHETRDQDGELLQIVHRDFSPQNILVGTNGVAKLTDFGIAKAASRTGNTSAGLIKGKVAYMSPEQARGFALDRRSDVWAAGVLTWEIAAGRLLWSREDEDVSTLIKLVTTPPPRVREVFPAVSDALDAAIAKALSMDPEDRWPTAASFAKAIASAAEVADTEELAEYVRRMAGPKIAQRRQQVRSMGALRAQIGEIAEASMTPSGRYLQPRVSAAAGERLPDGGLDVDVDATEFTEAPRFDEPLVPTRFAIPDAVSSSAMRVTSSPRAAPRWVIVAAGALIGLGVLVVLIALAPRSSSPPQTTDDSARAMTTAQAPPIGVQAPPTPTATASATAIPTPTATATPTPTPTAASTPTNAIVAQPPRPPHKPVRPPPVTQLAPSPY